MTFDDKFTNSVHQQKYKNYRFGVRHNVDFFFLDLNQEKFEGLRRI